MVAPRRRAGQACISCNARRVKCNVTECLPCRNCFAAGISCEIRESRRGKHQRSTRKPPPLGGPQGYQSPGSPLRPPVTQQRDDEVAVSQVLASLSRDGATGYSTKGGVPGGSSSPAVEAQSLMSQPRRPSDDAGPEDERSVFLGESTSIRYLHNEPALTTEAGPRPSTASRPRLLHSVLSAIGADGPIPEWEAERRRSRIRFLRAEGAFSLPARPVLEVLLKAYFSWFHPCFAIVDESDVWDQHRQGTLSPLLLQAILFIAVIHCEKADLERLGLGSRHRAKYVFYSRARDIYDAGYETKKLTVIQALFLMSFWRAGPLLEKDARHWLAAAISLAQTKALHRSAEIADTKVERLRKRIWWSIYVRERQCAAGLGLPHRIRDEDCDIEHLNELDFEHAFSPLVSKGEVRGYISYAIGLTTLSRTLGQIVHCGYLPNKSLDAKDRSRIKDELILWKRNLPPEMQPDHDFGEQAGFHANMLHLAYNNLLILLYRSAYIASADESQESDGRVALRAAARNSRIIEDMLPSGYVRHGQIHVITNLFNTLCVHTVSLRRSEGPAKEIAEHRAKLCLMGLQELQKAWEVKNWVLQLFFQYLDHSTAARLRIQGEPHIADTTRESREVPHDAESIASYQQQSRVASGPGPDSHPGTEMTLDMPWFRSTEEANQYLFSQIENEFASAGGGNIDWSSEDVFGNALSHLNHPSPDDMHL